MKFCTNFPEKEGIFKRFRDFWLKLVQIQRKFRRIHLNCVREARDLYVSVDMNSRNRVRVKKKNKTGRFCV